MRSETKMAIFLVVLAAFLWFFRGSVILHTFAMFVYTHVQIFAAAAIIAAVLTPLVNRDIRIDASVIQILTAWATVFFFMIFVVGVTLGLYGVEAMYTEIYHTTDYTAVHQLPSMDNSTVRAVPMVVAKSLLEKYFTEARYYPDGAAITMINGTLAWAGQLTPDGSLNHYTLEPSGIIYVPMDRMKVYTLKKNMKCGYDIGITDNVYWILNKHRYWVKYEDPIPVIENGTLYYVVPFIAYHARLTHMTPYWGGVAVVNTENCKVQYLPPQEAVKKYGELPIFPEKLAVTYALAMNYYMKSPISNIMNLLFRHINQTEIKEYNIGGNGQPFFVRLSNGEGAWFIAAEPYGKGNGVKRIIMITMDGKAYYRNFDNPITGVDAAISAIKNALPRFDWSQFKIVEPLPMEVHGKLYWRFVIVPNGASTIRMIALVPMKSTAIQPDEIKFFNTIEEFRAFITRGAYTAPKNRTLNGTLEALYVYTVNGTTHFILKLRIGPTEKLIDVPASCLNTQEIARIFELKDGEKVTLEWDGKCFVPTG